MLALDFAPLYRSTVGFDALNDLVETALSFNEASSYPPYNIEKHGENAYRITLAVAGFEPGQLSLEVRENTLVVAGRKDKREDVRFLHRGIDDLSFERRFQLADHVRVEGAHLADGLLTVDLVREVPEALKPRRIEIATGKPGLLGKAKKLIEGNKVA